MIRFHEAGDGTPEDERQHLLALAEKLHRQLRPNVPPPYARHLQRMFAQGAKLAVLTENDVPRALAVWRIYLTTYAGLRFYVDDLVTDETRRGQGWGGQMIAWLEERARKLGADTLALDSGVQRAEAHRFYFRAGLVVRSFSFAKALTGQ